VGFCLVIWHMTEVQVLLTALPLAALANAIFVWIAREETASVHSDGYRAWAKIRLWAMLAATGALLVLLARLAPFVLNAACSKWAGTAAHAIGLLNLGILAAALTVWGITHYLQFFGWRLGRLAAIGTHPICHQTRLAAIAVSFLSFVAWIWIYMPGDFSRLCSIF
jgi:hypothetical protein